MTMAEGIKLAKSLQQVLKLHEETLNTVNFNDKSQKNVWKRPKQTEIIYLLFF